jgi:hypothetical protein
MDMHNCFRECEVGSETLARNANALVDSSIRDLIERLARKHPHWRFVNSSYSGAAVGNSYTYRAFTIEDDDETLGSVNTDRHWRTGDVWYELTNHRLNAKRERKGPTRTKDINKATKLVEGHYFGATLAERVAKARGVASSVISDLHNDRRWTVDKLARQLQPHIMSLLTHNVAMRDMLARYAPKEADVVQRVPQAYAAFEDTQVFAKAKGGVDADEVMLFNGSIYMLTSDDGPYTYTTAPEYISMAIGMLKLVEVKGYIPGVGVRADTNVFHIMRPQEDNQ